MAKTERREHRITLPQHLRTRAQQRADELGYGSVLEYVSELVVVDTSPLIARGIAQVPQAPINQEQPTITVSSGDWGAEI
ncbi:MAG: hypothetical protein AAF572_26875 [Cyanobacteria bacterium P01_B01_bin.77]